MNLGEIRALLKKYNQEQLLNGYEKLDERKQKQLLEQIQNIDFELVNSLYLTTKQEQKQSSDEITPIEYMNTICSATTSKKEAIYIAQNHLNDFQKIAEQTISENGYTYPIKVEIGNFDFPTKTYGDISLPAGSYDALRVEIGKAQGQNWWCVMFPPLCFIDVSSGIVPDESKELLKENMNEEDFALISDNNSHSNITFKFKLLEFFGNKGFTTAKN